MKEQVTYDWKYPISEIQSHIEAAKEQVGKVGCTHETNIARAMIDCNRLINEEMKLKVQS